MLLTDALLAQLQAKNWPRCYPLVHHNIAGEVSVGRRSLVHTGYATWLILATAYLYNWLLITIM